MLTMWITKRWTVLGSRNSHGVTYTAIGHVDNARKTRSF
jgi:hypothetical protein